MRAFLLLVSAAVASASALGARGHHEFICSVGSVIDSFFLSSFPDEKKSIVDFLLDLDLRRI